MSKRRCYCGSTIHNISDNQAWIGRVLKQQDDEAMHSDSRRIISDYFQSVSDGNIDEWVNENTPGFSDKNDHTDYIMEVIHKQFLKYLVDICECESCGRIIIDKFVSGQAISFKPDSGGYHKVLTSEFAASRTE